MDVNSPTSVLERRDAILMPLDPRRFSTFVRLLADPKHRVVVSFGGGSVPGLAGNVALAGILEELGVMERVAEVWGTSAGAVIGACWSTGVTSSRILDELRHLDFRGSVDISWARLGWSILKKPFGGALPDGLIGGRHFLKAIDNLLQVKTFEETKIPFRCIACTDDGESQRKVFRRGPLLPAVHSSMAIPGIVIPRAPIEGETHGYYDGGLVEKTPLLSPISEHARSGRAEKLLLIGTHYGNDARKTQAKGFINRFLQSIYALEALAWNYQLAEARNRKDITLMILNPHIDDPALFDFSRVERNYLHAREVFSDLLQNAKLALSFGNC